MESEDLSIRRKTNKKTSVFEGMHKIQGYRWYSIYQMPFAPISSEEEESSSSAEDSTSSEESTSEE